MFYLNIIKLLIIFKDITHVSLSFYLGLDYLFHMLTLRYQCLTHAT